MKTNIKVNQGAIVREFNQRGKAIARNSEQIMIGTLKKEAPVKKGKLRNSIKKVASNTSSNTEGFNSSILVGVTALHAKYVIRKTAPSQGAYIPILDRRIKFGLHPGTPANDFVKRSKPIILSRIQNMINREFGPGRFNVAKHFR